MKKVQTILCTRPLEELEEYRKIYTQESSSTASQKRNETRSYGLDLSYAPSVGVPKATGSNPTPRALRPRRKKRAGYVAAAPAANAAPVESASAHVGVPPNA